MSDPSRAGVSPVVTDRGRGRWLAFAVAALMVIGGLGYAWLGASGVSGSAPPRVLADQTSLRAAKIAPVMDQADVLTKQTETQLSAKLMALKDELGPQLTVLTVSDLGDQSIDDYALAWFNRAGLGDASRNDGVLLVIAPNERRVRIEVGKGLTTVLSNQACQQIIDQMLPLFRAGQFDSAATAGVDAVIADLQQLRQFLPGKAA